MNYFSMTDNAIADELGKRLRLLRIKKNLTQEELAQKTMLSPSTIKSIEKGHGKLRTLIAVLRELDALNDLDAFIAEQTISPLQLAKMSGKKRQRASGKHTKSNKNEEPAGW